MKKLHLVISHSNAQKSPERSHRNKHLTYREATKTITVEFSSELMQTRRERSETFKVLGASLVAQWLRICLPIQGTRVRALVWEDPTGRGATKPRSHNY